MLYNTEMLREWAKSLNQMADVLEQHEPTQTSESADLYQWEVPKGEKRSNLVQMIEAFENVIPVTLVLGSTRSAKSLLINCVVFEGDYDVLIRAAHTIRATQSGSPSWEDGGDSVH